MTLTARNHRQDMIEEIQMGDVLAHVTVRVAGGITESVIGLKKGDTVTAVVTATEVMIAKP